MLDVIKNHADAIFGVVASGAAIVVPIIVRLVLGAIKNRQVQAALPGIVKGIFGAVEAISRNTPTTADDKAAKVLELVADEVAKQGVKPTAATMSRAASIVAAIEADPKSPNLAANPGEARDLIKKMLLDHGPSVAALVASRLKKAGAK